MYLSPKWSLRLGLWDKEDYRNIMQKILYMESNPNEIVTELTVEPHESDFGKVVLHVFGCGADKLIFLSKVIKDIEEERWAKEYEEKEEDECDD